MRIVANATSLVKGGDRLARLEETLKALADRRVLVGVPRETTDIRPLPATMTAPARNDITNAELAYIHDQGAPEANVPQREFMKPGIANALPRLIEGLKGACKAATSDAALTQGAAAIDKYFHRIGLVAQASIKAVIVAGIDPELAEATVAARIARRKSKAWRRKRQSLVDANIAAGKAAGAGIFTPLIDTAGMINSITYVIRRQNGRDIAVGPISTGTR